MSFSPISFIASNYRDYKNNWLKAYEPGTTTPKSMATDSTLNVLIAKAELNKDGFIVSASQALIIPYIDGAYDLWLFPTEPEADANDTSNALRVADNITGVNGAILANSVVFKFDVLQTPVDETSAALIFDGAALNIAERTTGNGGGAMWDVVLASTVTPNTLNIVLCVGVPTLALVLRDDITSLNIGMTPDADNSPLLDLAKDLDIIFTKGTYSTADNLTLTGTLTFESGAFLSATANTTSVEGKIIADDYPLIENGGSLLIQAVEYSSSGFSSVQDAIDFTPTKQWQRFELTIADGAYDEDVLVNSKFAMASVNTGGERAGLYIFGNTGNKNSVRVKSFMFVNGGGGSFTPAVSHLTMYGVGPRTNEAAPIEFYGVQGGAAHNIIFDDTTGSAARCVMSYGSTISTASMDFGVNKYDYAYTTKHGGRIFETSAQELGEGPSSFGTLKNKISQSISGIISFTDTSGMRFPQAQPHNVYGVGNGQVYDQGQGALYGGMMLSDSVSSYQSYLTSLSDFSSFGGVTIDTNNGMLMDTGLTPNSSGASIRRFNTCSNHAIHISQTFKAAMKINVMTGASTNFELGIGAGAGEPRVFIRVDENDVRLVTYNGTSELTSSSIVPTATILGVDLIIDIDIQPNGATNVFPTQQGFARVSITTRSFTVFTSERVDVVTQGPAAFQWNASATNPTGQASAYVSEIRLFRYPLFNASA